MKAAGIPARGLLSVLCTLAAFSAALGQPPPPPNPPTGRQAPPPARDAKVVPTGTGIIRGKVVGDDGSPLRRARVALAATDLSRATVTGLDGSFEFRQLPAARFRLSVSKAGYVTLAYGQRRPFQAGRPIDLAPGQALEGLVMRLARGAVITGRLLNDLGEPVAQTMVTAYRQRFTQGRLQLVPTGRFPETDDQGRFRLSGLPPGTYLVGTFALAPPGPGGGATVAEEGFVFAPSYHPATSDPALAAPITVKASEERPGADITLVPGRAVTVTGTAYDAAGRPVVGATVSARRSVNSLPIFAGTAVTGADGRFVLRDIGPGEQVIAITARNPETGVTERGETTVTTLGLDVDGVAVTAQAPGRVAGRFTFEPGVVPGFPASVLRLQSQGLPTTPPSLGVVRSDWGFELKDVWPGKTWLVVMGLPQGWGVRRISRGGDDVTRQGLQVSRGADLADVEVLLTDRPAGVSGTVTDEAGKTVEDCTVLLFTDDASFWQDGWRAVVTARPDQRGEFIAPDLLPGRWRVVALEYLDDGEEENPEFLKQVRDLATLVTIGEGESLELALKVVSPRG